MKPGLYTKVVRTAIALALVQIACNQYPHPATTAQDHGAYAGVQFAGQGDNLWFFDSRTGDVYRHYRSEAFGHWKVNRLGQALAGEPK